MMRVTYGAEHLDGLEVMTGLGAYDKSLINLLLQIISIATSTSCRECKKTYDMSKRSIISEATSTQAGAQVRDQVRSKRSIISEATSTKQSDSRVYYKKSKRSIISEATSTLAILVSKTEIFV